MGLSRLECSEKMVFPEQHLADDRVIVIRTAFAKKMLKINATIYASSFYKY